MKYYLAVDIGASSGRHIVGWEEDGAVRTEEIYRFPNGVESLDGHLTWNIASLLHHVQAGFDLALEKYGTLESASIDTWGCDYVLLRGDEPVLPCYAYRDNRTRNESEDVVAKAHEKIPFQTLYERTGCQFQVFNSVYQLYADKLAGRLEGVTALQMVPSYLMYRLCGNLSFEYTNATTMGLVNAETGEYDDFILDALGLPKGLFPKLQQPGTEVGTYKGVPLVLCASHDTASAVEGIPMDENAPYISSGTWSLLGVKTPKPLTDRESMAANYSNEGGVGYNRYQKNICGMWLVNRLQKELCPGKSFPEIVAAAEESAYEGVIAANDEAFLAPESMKAAFDEALSAQPPESVGDYFRCAYRSLAVSYRDALRELESNTGKTYDCLYIVGGGAKNAFLNRLTAEATGKKVIALPIEATALGNLKIQMSR